MSSIFTKVFKYKTAEFNFNIELAANSGLRSTLMVNSTIKTHNYQNVYSFETASLQDTINKAELNAKIWFDSIQTDQEELKKHITSLGFTEIKKD